jgi:hypothetical protein
MLERNDGGSRTARRSFATDLSSGGNSVLRKDEMLGF